jgi:(1->4)-alpha-D-glucan 1-alpha-D-glucosylmutase
VTARDDDGVSVRLAQEVSQAHPVSTYRLQCNAEFDLDDATRLVPYLAELGVDWIYLSPIFAARAGSSHGYDVIDPTRVNPEVGGRAALDRFSAAAHEAGMGVLLDIVPNHQAAAVDNPHWRALRDAGETGYFDAWFDADGRLVTRRFFDIGELVGVRVEDDAVFQETHALVIELLESRIVDGVRVDHIDGLVDPERYLQRFHDATGGAFVVVEKILARDETLPPTWCTAGTTGYEAGVALTELLIDPGGRERLERSLLAENGGVTFAEVERASKAFVLDELFQPEWARVRTLLEASSLEMPLREVTLALDVYRTYNATSEDRMRIERAGAHLPADAKDEVRSRLLKAPDSELATRWRQLSSALMAKGHEDTACYRYPALLAQNEVGGDPGADARDAVRHFHDVARVNRGLVATSTHDTKRSEDVRARLCVLSERAEAFEDGLARWRSLVRPDSSVTVVEERFVAQTLLGAWPLADEELPEYARRVEDYVRKALREAKQQTSWTNPDSAHERSVIECATRSIAGAGALFRDAFGELLEDVAFFGACNSLAMLTWKLAMPGIPDVYRGCELWDFSLVDPDNRRPVDFAHRAQSLAAAPPPLRQWRTGAVKLHVTAAGLRLRRAHHALFTDGEHVPVPGPDSVLAFARRRGDEVVVAVAPRFPTRITERGCWPVGNVWGDAAITLPVAADGAWVNALDGTQVTMDGHGARLADACAQLPVALLCSPGMRTDACWRLWPTKNSPR